MNVCCKDKDNCYECDFCDVCECEVDGDIYGFDVILKSGEEFTVQGCKECIREMHRDLTGESFPEDEEFELDEG